MFVIGMLMGGMNIRKVLTNKKAYFIALNASDRNSVYCTSDPEDQWTGWMECRWEEDPSDRISGDHCTCCFDSYADESGVWK